MKKLIERINKLKQEKRAVILAHSYQNIEIDEVADYVGDSLYLSQKAKERLSKPENCPMFGKHMSEEAKRKRSETRLTNHICEKITIQLTPNNEIVKIFWSTKQINRELLIFSGDVSKCCNGKQKSAGGYHWKYLYDNKLKNGEIIPGAITLGLITEEEALKQLQNST